MSLKQTGELIKSILNNVKISWIGMAIIILLLILFCVIKWILSKYKKGKRVLSRFDKLKSLEKNHFMYCSSDSLCACICILLFG